MKLFNARLLAFIIAGIVFPIAAKAQYVYKIKADTVKIYNTCDTAELVLKNRTQNILGFLYNKGQGVTEFRTLNLVSVGDSAIAISGMDTLVLRNLNKTNIDSFYRSRDTLFYRTTKGSIIPVKIDLKSLGDTNFVYVPTGDSMTWNQWPKEKVVGYDAYSSTDMPVLSNQAFQTQGARTYYNGLVVRDGDTGFDLAVNWDGELQGPNGAFLRTKDDTKTKWSAWRELVFKDFADTAYVTTQKLRTPGLMQVDWNNIINFPSSGVVPAAGSANYIQNQTATNQAASFAITGAGQFNTAAYKSSIAGNTITSNNRSGLNIQSAASINSALVGPQVTGFSWRWLSNDNAVVDYSTDANEKMRLTFTGNLGIGTSTPTHKLEVAGTTSLNGVTTLPTVTSTLLKTNAAGDIVPAVAGTDYAAVAGGSSYIQNQNSSAQTATSWISGSNAAQTFTSTANTSAGGNQHIILNGGTGTTAGTNARWAFQLKNAESSSNAGSDFVLASYTDAGAGLTYPFSILRSTGVASFTSIPNAAGNPVFTQANHPGGTAFSQVFSGATVLSTLTTNAAGHVTGLGVRTLTAADLGAAPAFAGGYIQNQTGSDQTANFQINGSGIAKLFQVYTPTIGAGGGISFQESSNIRFWINSYNNKLLIGGNGGAPTTGAITITYNGADSSNVGINMASPTAKLHVKTTTGLQQSLFLEQNGSNLIVAPVTSGGSVTQINNTGGGGLMLQNAYAGNVTIGTKLGIGGVSPTNYLVMPNNQYIAWKSSADATEPTGIKADASNNFNVVVSGNTKLMVQSSNGNVGIGTTTPASKLDVTGGNISVNGGTISVTNGTSAASGGSTAISLSTVGANTNSGYGAIQAFYAGIGYTTPLVLQTTGGNVGIGTTTPATAYKLDVNGNVQATGFYQASLRSLKKNIEPFNKYSLDILSTVKVRTFVYKADTANITHIGFIADEVPDEMASPGHKGVDQANTVALLVKAMQEMKANMEQQQQQVADLKKQVTDLQQQLKEVKSK